MASSFAITAIEVLSLGYATKHVFVDRMFRGSNISDINSLIDSIVKFFTEFSGEKALNLVIDLILISVYVNLLLRSITGNARIDR